MILDQIAKDTQIRVAKKKEACPLEEIREKALACENTGEFPFEKALAGKEMSFICEVKRASPSKGVIAPVFLYLQIAEEYEKAGASAISCLTEPKYFLGQDRYLREIASKVNIPVLRKDFTVDSYQVYEAKVLGASAVLLICSLLEEETLRAYVELAHSLGLSALVEAHDEGEIEKALRAGTRILGVNNRNLKDFTVDVENSLRLRQQVPEDVIFVAESGIRTGEDIEKLKKGGVQAVLIGETLMRSRNKGKMLQELKEGKR